MAKEKEREGEPKFQFQSAIAYVRKPIPGVTLYKREEEETTDEMLEKLDKQDLDAIKRVELIARIKTRAAEAEQKRLGLLGGKPVAEAKERRFTIVNNQPVLDPEGEYTFSEALRTCALAAGEKTGVPGDKVSDILTAIQPFMQEGREAAKEAEGKKQETSLAVLAIEAMKGQGTGAQAQQPLTFSDMLMLFEKMEQLRSVSTTTAQPRTILDELAQLGSTFEVLQKVFGGGSRGEGPAPVVVTLPGTDGKGGLPFDTFLKWDDHNWNRHKEEVKFSNDMKNAESIRDFVGKLSGAAARWAPKEES